MALELGAAFAGVVASVSGLSTELTRPDLINAAFWVPIAFVAFALLACLAALRLVSLTRA